MSENKHQSWDLAQMQSLPLNAKIRMTQDRIRGWYEHFDGNVYVSISGGKDSQVLAHIVKEMYPDVPLVFVNTGLEYDSVMKKGTDMADEVLKPTMDFLNVIIKYGYPIISKEVSEAIEYGRKNIADGKNTLRVRQLRGEEMRDDGKPSQFNKTKWQFLLDAPFRLSNKCCGIMKKNSAKNYQKTSHRYAIIGTMANESAQRKSQWIKFGCNAFEKNNPTSQPLSFWTEQDILKYIKRYNLKIAEAYGDVVYVDEDGMFYENDMFNDSMKLITTGANRTGCVFCMFGINQDKERFLRLKEIEPQKYDYVMRGGKFDDEGMWIPHNGLGYKFVIDWLNEHGNLGIKY